MKLHMNLNRYVLSLVLCLLTPFAAMAQTAVTSLHGTVTDQSGAVVAGAHVSIAANLDNRGVYTEALSHAKEAAVLDSSNAWAFHDEAIALNHLQRYNEAIIASKEALRLSDGKFPEMHFTLGSSYFDAENWELATRRLEKAAELDPAFQPRTVLLQARRAAWRLRDLLRSRAWQWS